MKKIGTIILIMATCLALGIMLTPTFVVAKTTYVSIGTGSVTGVYFQTAGAVARTVNKKRKTYGIRCIVESTGGSVYNVNAIMEGDLEFGLVQSDRQFQAVKGLAEWKQKGPQKDLRAMFSLYEESLTLVAADDAGIKSINDLKYKRVNIGNPGSGTRQNSIDALANVGIDYQRDLKAEEVKAAKAPGLLLDGRIDAFFYTVSHPNDAIKEATAGRRRVRLVPVTGLNELVQNHPYYRKLFVPIKYYPRAVNNKDVETFGVKATFVTSAKVSEDIVYTITKEVFDNLESFKSLHPVFERLTKQNMLEGMSAPIHPGAMKYYKEEGLM